MSERTRCEFVPKAYPPTHTNTHTHSGSRNATNSHTLLSLPASVVLIAGSPREGGIEGDAASLVDRARRRLRVQAPHVTDSLIFVNGLTFFAQKISRGWLLAWGCKHNAALLQGQMWRLVTPAFLHGSWMHLLVNTISLTQMGPKAEALFGWERMLSVYALSGVAGNLCSLCLSPLPSVGSSGALFGLLGALGCFYYGHRDVLGNQVDAPLRSLRNVLFANLVLGAYTPNIDNWAHVGGLVAGAATLSLLGPKLKIERDGKSERNMLVDRPPIPLFAFKPLALL